MQTKLSSHLKIKHNDVPEVKAYLQLTDPDPKKAIIKRREACKLMINISYKTHNDNGINGESVGEPIYAKASKTVTPLSHVVCSHCGLFLLKRISVPTKLLVKCEGLY